MEIKKHGKRRAEIQGVSWRKLREKLIRNLVENLDAITHLERVLPKLMNGM
jgi:hypothetical protein